MKKYKSSVYAHASHSVHSAHSSIAEKKIHSTPEDKAIVAELQAKINELLRRDPQAAQKAAMLLELMLNPTQKKTKT